MSYVIGLLRRLPALSFVAIASAIASLVIYHWHLNQAQSAWVSTLVIGLGSVVTAVRTHHREVAVLVGFAGTVFTGLATFGIDVPPNVTALILSAVGTLLGILLHANLSPRLAPGEHREVPVYEKPVVP